jgi:hypothetical protein
MDLYAENFFRLQAVWHNFTYRITFGWQTAPLKGVTLPQLLQVYFISATIGAHTWRGSLVEVPQCLQIYTSSVFLGEQR